MTRGWADDRAATFVAAAAELGVVIDHAAARAAILDRLSAVAAGMGITEQSARRYLTDDRVQQLARDLIADHLADEQPGLDLATAPADTPLDPRLAALAVMALAEATLVHLANPDRAPSGLVGECVGMLSVHGARLYAAVESGTVAVSKAWLARAARYLRSAADTLDHGGSLGGPGQTTPTELAARLRADADLLHPARQSR